MASAKENSMGVWTVPFLQVMFSEGFFTVDNIVLLYFSLALGKSLVFTFQVLSHLSKCFLSTLYQMDTLNKWKGFRKCSVFVASLQGAWNLPSVRFLVWLLLNSSAELTVMCWVNQLLLIRSILFRVKLTDSTFFFSWILCSRVFAFGLFFLVLFFFSSQSGKHQDIRCFRPSSSFIRISSGEDTSEKKITKHRDNQILNNNKCCPLAKENTQSQVLSWHTLFFNISLSFSLRLLSISSLFTLSFSIHALFPSPLSPQLQGFWLSVNIWQSIRFHFLASCT